MNSLIFGIVLVMVLAIMTAKIIILERTVSILERTVSALRSSMKIQISTNEDVERRMHYLYEIKEESERWK